MRFTRPSSSACDALSTSERNSSSFALASPSVRTSGQVMPKSPLKPTFAKAVVSFALSAARRRSQASAMPMPAPAQAPLMAAMLAFGQRVQQSGEAMDRALPIDLLLEGPVGRSTRRSPIAVTSPPAQKPRPAPVTTMHPTAASSAQRSSVAIAASSIGRESAFSRSGRFMVSTATPSSRVST